MTGPYDHPMRIPPSDQFEQSYSMYDQQQYGGFQRMPGPPTPQEAGYGFWYRPNAPQETIYHRDPAIYNRAMPMQSITMESQASIKHRRTRSGCFTCRSRRVKCDETRPVCDRCRKGNRDCEFPQSSSLTKRAKLSSGEKAEGGSSKLQTIKDESDEDEDYEEEEDEQEDDEDMKPPQPPPPPPPPLSAGRSGRPKPNRQSTGDSISSKARKPRSPSESISAGSHENFSPPSSQTSGLETPVSPVAQLQTPSRSQRWKQLKPDLKQEMEMYLHFQQDHMTHYHYLFKLDPDDFIHGELINLALQFEPLLYAVVAFAAYHHTVRLPDSEADFNSFWKYYCKSIIKLRKCLATTKERDDLVLLTVLQLATFEEYMGDWTNLSTHHGAAHGILTSNYTPTTIMETDRGRRILDWFSRLDVIKGLMAVRDVSLDKSWVTYAHEWYKQRTTSHEGDPLHYKMEYFGKSFELIGHDVAHLFAEANKALEQPNFTINTVLQPAQELIARLEGLRCEIQEIHASAPHSVDDIQPSDDDVFDPHVPLFRGRMWPLNLAWINWYGISLLFKHQITLALQKALQVRQAQDQPSVALEQFLQEHPLMSFDLREHAKTQCQIYNAITRSPDAPRGVLLVCYANIGVSTVFLPQAPPASNDKYTRWSRLQLANIEREGYVWPVSFRKQMATLWNDPDVENWWLPNGEGKRRILTEIRAEIEGRIAAQSPEDGRNDLREIKGVFEQMEIGRRRGSSVTSEAPYVNVTPGMAHAASLVSTPEDGSSAGSVSGFSPRESMSEQGNAQKRPRNRQGSLVESPLVHSKSAPVNRMSGIWEDPQ